jgi:oligoendopeptidase F
MKHAAPSSIAEVQDWKWADYEPLFQELMAQELSEDTMHAWLAGWKLAGSLIYDTHSRLYVAKSLDTTDPAIEARYNRFLEEIYQPSLAADQKLKEKLLASGLEPANFEVPLRNLRAEADLFREENLPLLTEQQKLVSQYDRIAGAQTVEWEGEEKTIAQLRPVYQDADRAVRERAYRMAAERQLADREAFNELWTKLLALRLQIATNAGKDSYTSYAWQERQRFDYSPEDCASFRSAIEQVVVPAARRVYERRRRQLGVETLRPWDLDVDPLNRAPLKPFDGVDELQEKADAIFHKVDPQLGRYFRTMRKEGLLDLDNRKGKGPGAYCIDYIFSERPFIFMNAVGLADDVRTILHESGHAFHVFEIINLPYLQQMNVPMEFAEVASMAMELLASPYLEESEGGYYSPAEAARSRIEHLERNLLFWPYMAVVDGFQHWVYANPELASEPANCDAAWSDLWDGFMQGVDYSGMEEHKQTGWHRKLHIFRYPFYYVEYGLAQLGAAQVWNNALQDQAGAVAAYRQALALGGTATLPDLFATAGAKFAFDAPTLQVAVDLIEKTIAELESV